LKIEKDAILTCSTCGTEGPHELLYLSEHLSASRCPSCGSTQVYSGHIYSEYARDLAERFVRLPGRFLDDAFHHPVRVVGWPLKAIFKPYGLLREFDQVSSFERNRPARKTESGVGSPG
jgi:predicted RNA-binding Zn-ribbon protein involved in translation (DUF1610 family)